MVDLPEAERPVNQSVKPVCFRKEMRSERVRDGCHVMLVAILDSAFCLKGEGMEVLYELH